MKQKIVIKVHMTCDKCRKNALVLAGSTHGVQSVEIEGDEQDRLVVVGDGVDAASLTDCLRKKVKVCRAHIVKVEPVVQAAAAATTTPAAEGSSPNAVAEWPTQWCPYPYHPIPGYYCPSGARPGAVHPYPYAGHFCVEDPCADEGAWPCTIM